MMLLRLDDCLQSFMCLGWVHSVQVKLVFTKATRKNVLWKMLKNSLLRRERKKLSRIRNPNHMIASHALHLCPTTTVPTLRKLNTNSILAQFYKKFKNIFHHFSWKAIARHQQKNNKKYFCAFFHSELI